MKSFPSTFTKDNLVNQGSLASVNIKQTLKNMAGQVMNGILNGGNKGAVTKDSLGEYLKWENYDYNYTLSNTNFTLDNYEYDSGFNLYDNGNNKPVYENARKIPAVVLASMNKYRRIYKHSATQFGVWAPKEKGKTDKQLDFYNQGVTQSLFNPWFGVNFQGFTIHTPLLNDTYDKDVNINTTSDKEGDKAADKDTLTIQTNNADPDFTDCSIQTLVKLSNGSTNKRHLLGRATYRFADFMYCKDLGKVSNNHLITLRKFPTPVPDNIMGDIKGDANSKQVPSVGTLISWFGTDDNKLEDICKFSFNAEWQEIKSEIQDVQSKEDDGHILNSLVNVMSPGYNAGVAAGKWGGGNAIYNWMAGKVGFLQATGTYENDPDLYYRDNRYSWAPKNSIQTFQNYTGELKFQHSFTLNFSYTLRSYDNINPKSAFLDLIGNILEVTYRRGTFWGGSHRWLGAPRNTQAWKKINNIFDKIESNLDGGIDELFSISSVDDLGNWFKGLLGSLGNMLGDGVALVKNAIEDGSLADGAKKLAKDTTKATMGMLKNKLGRPAIYGLSTIASDADAHQGIWHLTVGNPRNPILSIGNLVMKNAEITQSGPLGIDDFPTELRVSVTLEHGRPRDVTEIGRMYTCGQGGLLLPLNSKVLNKYANVKNMPLDFGLNSTDDRSNTDVLNGVWANLGK